MSVDFSAVLSAGRVPQPDRAVSSTRSQQIPVWRPGHAEHVSLVSRKAQPLLMTERFEEMPGKLAMILLITARNLLVQNLQDLNRTFILPRFERAAHVGRV